MKKQFFTTCWECYLKSKQKQPQAHAPSITFITIQLYRRAEKKKFYELKTEVLSDLTSHPGLRFSGQSYVCKQHSVYQNQKLDSFLEIGYGDNLQEVSFLDDTEFRIEKLLIRILRSFASSHPHNASHLLHFYQKKQQGTGSMKELYSSELLLKYLHIRGCFF